MERKDAGEDARERDRRKRWRETAEEQMHEQRNRVTSEKSAFIASSFCSELQKIKKKNNKNNQCGGEWVDLSLTLQRCSLQLFSVHTEDLQLSSISTTTQQPDTWHHPPTLWLAGRDAGLRLVQQCRGGEGEEVEEVVLVYFRGILLTSN